MEDIFKFLLIAGIIVISFVRQAKKEAKKKAGNSPAMPVFDEENPLPESWSDGTYGGYIPEGPKPETAVIRKKTEKKHKPCVFFRKRSLLAPLFSWTFAKVCAIL